MTTENNVLLRQAKRSLDGKWGIAVATFLVYMIIINASAGLGPVVLVIGGPMVVGISIFSLNIARGEEARMEQIFDGFKNFGNTVGAYILYGLFVFLWSLLLIIPGIIAAISYSQTFFILAEDNEIGPMDALKKSRDMMEGHKWKYFELCLIFFGLSLLCILTLGIGFLFLFPFMQVTFANFYDDLKGEFILEEDDIVDEDILDKDLV